MPPRRDSAEFVRAWLASSTIAEVSAKVGLSPDSVSVYAVRLRRLGVNLPKKQTGPRGPHGVDRTAEVAELNALIEQSKAVSS